MSKSKRKLLISMLVAMFVLLSAVAVVAIAFALTQQTITTTLNIGYTVSDLDGSVSATYTVGGTTSYLNPKATGGSVSADGNSLVFDAEDKTAAGTLDFPSDINLTSANDTIVIKYTYANTGDKHYIASMSFAGDRKIENMNIYYGIGADDEHVTYSKDEQYALVVPTGETRSYWIKISIDNKAKSASFSGDFRWDLRGCNQDQESADYLSLTLLEFTGSNGSYSVSIASIGDYTGTIAFPRSINDVPVTKIVQNTNLTKEEKLNIKSVYIPNTVTEIGEYAFRYCGKLETVIFEQNTSPSSSSTGLQTIGQNVFYSCESLTEITIPSTVTSIGIWCFAGASSLTKLILPSNLKEIGSGSLAICNKLTELSISNNDKFICEGNCVIEKSSNTLVMAAGNISIPNYITTIKTKAIVYCTITNITIPTSVTTIEANAFDNSTITNITFENKSNWTISGTDLTSSQIEENLADTKVSATYLTKTYKDYKWTRS